ncbi:uncharacterized protein METZ01_LOCUS6744 [marine metagenome]|uniref:DUF1611 domain-containing protein n=1 Tax=marine metagenome TaxID=408172 RepID=A0A381NH24_9ZZZZ
MKVSGNAIVLTNGKFDTKSAKTAHGLIRGSKRFIIKSVIDDKFHAKYVHSNKHGNVFMSSTKSKIPVFKNVESFLEAGIDVNYCIIGVASAGGILPEEMRNDVILALNNNISIVNGLHSILNYDSQLKKIVDNNNVKIYDVRVSKSRDQLSFWSGKIYDVKSPKIVVLGTDCGLGKRTTAKLVVEALEKNKITADMIYTGQTGWMQGWDYGFIFDSTLNDFVSGELEKSIYQCYKDKKPDFILIEGQAALRNPSGPCGSEFLISANVDGVILQHSPKRKYFDGWEHIDAIMPSLDSEIELIKSYGKEVIAITLNTQGMTEQEKIYHKKLIATDLNIPVFLPIDEGMDGIVEILKNKYGN